MRVELSWLLWLAPVIAGALGLLAWYAHRVRVRAARQWSEELGVIARRGGTASLVLLSVTSLIAAIAAAGPRFGRNQGISASRALNLVIAVDISRSMLAEDAEPNRLSHSIQEARRLLQESTGNRVGLLAFSGRSYILTPLTLDVAAVYLYLDHLDPDLASEGGTNLAGVLRQGLGLLEAATEGGDRALIIFTDGEGHDSVGGALSLAGSFKQAGVSLIVAAQGTVAGSPIPLRDSNGELQGYLDDPDQPGQLVVTRRDDGKLRSVVAAAGGTLIMPETGDQAGAIRAVLESLERRPVEERRVDDLIPRAWIGALVAAVLLLVHAMTRRSAALVMITLAIGVAQAAAQRPSEPLRRLQLGDTVSALEQLRKEANLTVNDTAWYNVGTVSLSGMKWLDADSALGRSLGSRDAEVKFRSLYNRGLSLILQARQDSASSDSLLDAAAAHLRQALLIRPASMETKWNLELTQRPVPPHAASGGSGGGGGGGGSGAPSGTGGGNSQGPVRPNALNPSEAERILASVEQVERGVRAEQVERRRGLVSRSGRDW